MARPLRQLMRLALDTDTAARAENGLWRTRCLHCRAHVTVAADGTPLGTSTLEHIVPRSWFGRSRARDATSRKGVVQTSGPADGRAHEIVNALLVRRRARFR